MYELLNSSTKHVGMYELFNSSTKHVGMYELFIYEACWDTFVDINDITSRGYFMRQPNRFSTATLEKEAEKR